MIRIPIYVSCHVGPKADEVFARVSGILGAGPLRIKPRRVLNIAEQWLDVPGEYGGELVAGGPPTEAATQRSCEMLANMLTALYGPPPRPSLLAVSRLVSWWPKRHIVIDIEHRLRPWRNAHPKVKEAAIALWAETAALQYDAHYWRFLRAVAKVAQRWGLVAFYAAGGAVEAWPVPMGWNEQVVRPRDHPIVDDAWNILYLTDFAYRPLGEPPAVHWWAAKWHPSVPQPSLRMAQQWVLHSSWQIQTTEHIAQAVRICVEDGLALCLWQDPKLIGDGNLEEYAIRLARVLKEYQP